MWAYGPRCYTALVSLLEALYIRKYRRLRRFGCGNSEKRKPYMYKGRSALPYIPALYIGYIYSTPS